ncbi:MAG: hypothetical protein VX737_01125 [Pseudomonadota bacterium]|nr:hypothetical protein [Pseudomonadota bacterium]
MNAHNSKLSQAVDTTLNADSMLVTDLTRILFLDSVASTIQSLSYSNRYCLVKRHTAVKFTSTLYFQADVIQSIQCLREIIHSKQFKSTAVFMNRYSLMHSRVPSISDVNKLKDLKSSLQQCLSLSKHWPLEINRSSVIGGLISELQSLLKIVCAKKVDAVLYKKSLLLLDNLINVSSSLIMIKKHHAFIFSNRGAALIKNNHFKAHFIKFSTKKSKRITTLNQVNKLMQNFSQAITLDKLSMMRQSIQSYITKYGAVNNPILWMSSHDALLSIKNCDKLLVKISKLDKKQLSNPLVQKHISQMPALIDNALKSEDVNMKNVIKKAKEILKSS